MDRQANKSRKRNKFQNCTNQNQLYKNMNPTLRFISRYKPNVKINKMLHRSALLYGVESWTLTIMNFGDEDLSTRTKRRRFNAE